MPSSHRAAGRVFGGGAGGDVRMEWLLVDDTGYAWSGSSAQVRRAHAFSGTAGEFAAYAVKHLGFIEINA